MESWAAILGFFGLVGGIARWLLGYYFKSQREIQNLKASQLASAISTLRDEISAHKVSISQLCNRLNSLEQKLQVSMSKFDNLKEELKETNSALKEFAKRIEEKQDKLASENIRIAEKLVLVRGLVDSKTSK